MNRTLALLPLVLVAWSPLAAADSGVVAVYDTTPDALWALVDFHEPSERIMPPIAASERTGEGVGATKINTLAEGGGRIHLQLVHYDPRARAFNYVIRKGPLPVSDYVGLVRVTATDDGKARLSWRGVYRADGVPQEQADAILGGFYAAIAERIGETFPRLE